MSIVAVMSCTRQFSVASMTESTLTAPNPTPSISRKCLSILFQRIVSTCTKSSTNAARSIVKLP
jgi:hypothetical protein